MLINASSVHCNGGFLPEIILLTLCDYIGEPVTDPILPGLAHVPFHDVVGRTLRGEEQHAEEVLVRALPRCHARRVLCGCRFRIALENGRDVLPIERQDDAKPVLVLQTPDLIFAIKTWTEIQHCLDAVGIMLRHDTMPIVEYQTRTVELPSMFKFTRPTLHQAAMHYV